MSPEENEFISRIIKNNQDNADQLTRAMEGQKTLFQQLVKMEADRNFWKEKAQSAEAEVRRLMIQMNRPQDG